MIRLTSRVLSLIVVAVALWAAWGSPTDKWYVVLGVVPMLVFIWFPEKVDDYTFGTWRDGYRIDSHTPAVMIAIAGWFLLLLFAAIIVAPDFLANLFGVI